MDLARQHGARVALDAAQLAPHGAVDIAALGVDYVAFSGHKLYAPFGAGVLVGRADWLDAASPYLRGGGATAQVTTDGRSAGPTGAARHEAGSPNVIGAIALAAACATLTAHRDAVEAHEARAGRPGCARAWARSTGVHTLLALRRGPPPRRRRHLHHRRARQLAGRRRPCPRSTASACATASSARTCSSTPCWTDATAGTAVRASVGLANTAEHVDRLLRAVATLAATGPAFDYALTADGWVPAEDPRDLSLPRPW